MRAAPASLAAHLHAPQVRQPRTTNPDLILPPAFLFAGVRFGVESDKGEFMNHCCEPNCGAYTPADQLA